jgi:hypothetical protein
MGIFGNLFGGKKSVKPVKIATKPAEKPIGEVTHYYDKAGVAVIKFNKDVAAGTRVKFMGATTDFEETLSSMQLDHAPVSTAKKGAEVGVKVSDKVREGDGVYAA